MNPSNNHATLCADGWRSLARHGRAAVRRCRRCLPDLATFFGALVAAGIAAALAALLAAALSGCGGGVGTEGTGSFASGSITGFGSIVVGGVHFDESSARIEDDDGAPLDRAALALGMVVQVSAGPIVSAADGSQSAVATLVHSSRALVGPATAVDVAQALVVVLGQTVALSADTAVDPRLAGGLAALRPGQWIEVYGFYDAGGSRYAATRIALADSAAGQRISGPVSVVDSQRKTFTIGSQSYRYDMLAGAAPVDGALLSLQLQPGTDGNGRWQVSGGRAQAAPPRERDGAELGGLVSALQSASRFTVDGVSVDASAARVSGGTLRTGARVAVSGVLRSGVLVASQVSVEADAQARGYEVRGVVQSLDLGSARMVLRAGVRDTAVSLARTGLVFDNGSRAELAVGRRLRVEGLLSADRTLIEATEIRFDD